ncbi:MAG TPA: tetratricopeptide repeat protein, partial [Methylomirabilota bacterium]|nr:tetratricopeptide repeat protein [Methylomirabilota bacterium]
LLTILYKRDIAIFIDDLQDYAPVESHEVNLQTLVVDNQAITLQTLMDTVRRTTQHVVVVATCRLEDEATVRAHLSWLFDELAIVTLPRFKADAHDSGTATVISEFQKHGPINIRDWDGTLGSLVLGLSKKNSEYLKIRNEPAATVLRSMKLLTLAGTTDHTEKRIQRVCAEVFDENMPQKSTGIWRSAVDQLTRLQFVTEEKISGEDDLGLVIRKDVYFDQVITDYPNQNRPHQLDQDLVQLQIAFTKLKDTQGLVNLARVLHQLGQDNKALEVYDLASALNPNDEIIWIRKGILLIILKQYREALATYDHALSLNPNSVPSKEGKNLALLFMRPNKVPKANSEHDVDLKTQTYQLIDEFLSSHMKEEVETFRELWKELKLFPLETLGRDLKRL